MKVRRILATLTAVVGLALVGAAPASADPKRDFSYVYVCDSLGTIEIVGTGNGAASPGLDLDGNGVILAYEWEVTLYATPYVGDPFTRVFSYSRGEPQNGRLDYCTFEYDVYNDVGHGHFVGWSRISYTP
ncbi:MAG TPA: hypothetical protein VF855_14630 [Acidimicrobiales bacterium]